jgi:hypothetical protein
MRRRGNIYSRLEWLEARTPTPASPPERSTRVGDFLDRLVVWRRAGCPDTEEGRELRALSEAFRRLRAELRGRGDSYSLNVWQSRGVVTAVRV